MSAELIARLIEAGTPPALVAEVAMALGQAAGDQAAIARRRERDAARQHARRTRDSASRDVTLAHVTSRDDADETPSPAPPSPKPPQNPQEPLPPHPHPDGIIPHTRGAGRWKPSYPVPAGVTGEQWDGFVEHRLRHPKGGKLTERAYTLLCRRLAKLAEDGWPPGEMIDRAIERGWITVFPPDEKRNGQRSHHDRPDDEFRNPLVRAAVDDAARRAARDQLNLGG